MPSYTEPLKEFVVFFLQVYPQLKAMSPFPKECSAEPIHPAAYTSADSQACIEDEETSSIDGRSLSTPELEIAIVSSMLKRVDVFEIPVFLHGDLHMETPEASDEEEELDERFDISFGTFSTANTDTDDEDMSDWEDLQVKVWLSH